MRPKEHQILTKKLQERRKTLAGKTVDWLLSQASRGIKTRPCSREEFAIDTEALSSSAQEAWHQGQFHLKKKPN